MSYGIPDCLTPPAAQHGGTYLDEVMIDTALQPFYGQLCRETLTAWQASNPVGLKCLAQVGRFPFIHEAMSDGSLEFSAVSPTGELTRLNIAAGLWHSK